MAGLNSSGIRSFIASAAIPQFSRVKFTGGKVAVAGATENAVGFTERASFADGDNVAVFLNTFPGTVPAIASKAIAAGAAVYAAASGKVTDSDAGSALFLGYAGTAAAANNDVIELIPYPTQGDLAGVVAATLNGYVVNATTSVTVLTAALGLVQTTILLSFNGTVALAIPGGDAALEGARLRIQRTANAGAVTATPADGTIGGAGTYALVAASGDWAEFVSDGTNWILIDSEIAE